MQSRNAFVFSAGAILLVYTFATIMRNSVIASSTDIRSAVSIIAMRLMQVILYSP